MKRQRFWTKQQSICTTILLLLHILNLIHNGLGIPLSENNEIGLKQKENICYTSECVRTASEVLDLMDPSADPCDDFYQFACGKFVKEVKIPDEKHAITIFDAIEELILNQVKRVIEKPIKPKELRPFMLIKNLYKACMNINSIEERGLKEIKEIIVNVGGWPVLEGSKWNEATFDWKQMTHKIEKTGLDINYLITHSIELDNENSSRRIVNLNTPSFGLSKQFLRKGLENKFVKAYYSYMVDTAIIFGADRESAERELLESLEFEIGLANISFYRMKKDDFKIQHDAFTVLELQLKYPSIPWLEYINSILSPHDTITNNETVVISTSFFDKFEALMNATSKRTQANYLIRRMISSVVQLLPQELHKLNLKFHTVVDGVTEMEFRWKQCVKSSFKILNTATSALYVREYFKEADKKVAQQLFYNIKAVFRRILSEVDWMDEKTRKHALEKVDMMTSHIGYPNELLDDAKLEEYHKDFEVDPENYFISMLNINKRSAYTYIRRLHLPVDKTDWTEHSSSGDVNAFYFHMENSIKLPAGILQGTIFNRDSPSYMNYGGVGFIIGHEITHGFDSNGRQYNKDGNLMDWWSPDVATVYTDKAQCIIEHYDNYTVPEVGLNINGIKTLSENIADIGGTKLAYFAYDNWTRTHGEEPQLPGLNYTGRQLFWISAANTWCSKRRPEALERIVLENEHPPGKYRVWGVVSNAPEFAKDFNCAAGTKMNPKNKCHLW